MHRETHRLITPQPTETEGGKVTPESQINQPNRLQT